MLNNPSTNVSETRMGAAPLDGTRKTKVAMMRTILILCVLLGGAVSMAYGADSTGQDRRAIDRQAVVTRAH